MDPFDDITELLRDSAAAFLAQRHTLARLKGGVGKAVTVDRTIWRELAEAGWLAIGLPEALGGLDAGLGPSAVLAEMFGRVVLPEPFVSCGVIPATILAAAERQNVASLAESFVTGEQLLALAWQEGEDGLSDATFTTRLKDRRISGRKWHVEGAEAGSVLLVACQSDAGLVIATVEADAPGVKLDRRAAGNVAVAHIDFDDAPITRAPLLTGASADAALRRALEAGRVVLSAELAGLAAGALDLTVRYVSDRVQFGQAIGTFQTVQHRCVDRHIETLLAGATWRAAVRAFDAAPLAPATLATVSAAKARCSDAALASGKTAIQLHGAIGFTEEADIGLYFRAAMRGAASLGSATAHRRRLLSNRDHGADADA